ncbi:MAG: ATP-dependent helicase [Caldilineaceae bacterium]
MSMASQQRSKQRPTPARRIAAARRTTPTLALTPQQQAIVNHDTGPALVYAVAGAGKTTAMVHRIARLVGDRVFAPERILATSFNRDANAQIQAALAQQRGCDPVQVRTLHALGYSIVRMAQARGYLPRLRADSLDKVHAAERQLLHATVDGAHAARVAYVPQLAALDGDEFLGYVRRQKAMLCFPDPRALGLPRRLRRVAQRAQAPRGRAWYADLYARFEQERLARGLLTFDDMLATGWLMLAQHADILAAMQQRYECVLVDEFQDVNRAQAEILDLLTAPHRNYMAIGDDDQTIYTWRGASPFFIRSFRKRYRATVYFMTDNFRSRAVHLALANQVIRHDNQRQEKYLQLTQGFGGSTVLETFADEEAMAQATAQAMQRHHRDGIAGTRWPCSCAPTSRRPPWKRPWPRPASRTGWWAWKRILPVTCVGPAASS